MPKAYLIGGAPRAGKTTVIQRAIITHPMFAASTDAIRSVARGLLTEENNPRLFKVGRSAFDSETNMQAMLESPEKVFAYYLAEYEETWKSVLDFIDYNIQDGKDVAIEGVAVLPKVLADMPYDHKVVFVVNLSDQTATVLKHAHEHAEDWLHKYNDEVIRAFCYFNQFQNRYYYEEARKYGLPVVTVDDDFDASMSRAASILLGD